MYSKDPRKDPRTYVATVFVCDLISDEKASAWTSFVADPGAAVDASSLCADAKVVREIEEREQQAVESNAKSAQLGKEAKRESEKLRSRNNRAKKRAAKEASDGNQADQLDNGGDIDDSEAKLKQKIKRETEAKRNKANKAQKKAAASAARRAAQDTFANGGDSDDEDVFDAGTGVSSAKQPIELASNDDNEQPEYAQDEPDISEESGSEEGEPLEDDFEDITWEGASVPNYEDGPTPSLTNGTYTTP